MINKKHILLFLFLLQAINFSMNAQVIETNPAARYVISTTGGTAELKNLNLVIDYTVGECIVETDSNNTPDPVIVHELTQGFQQPDDVRSVKDYIINSTCIGANNGSITVVAGTTSKHIHYEWKPSVVGDTNTASNLAPGTYMCTIRYYDTIIAVDTIMLKEEQVDCTKELTFYKGITPNNDGFNDTWVIDGITNFNKNKVSIFNRWGDLVWNKNDYDNVNVVWNGTSNKGMLLPDATYFYVIEAGAKTFKGWVELTR